MRTGAVSGASWLALAQKALVSNISANAELENAK
jgi:hypothetical protein